MKGKFIYHIADEQTYEDGQVIFREDTPGDWVYVVLSGEVEMYKTVEGHQHVIGRLQPGEVFGEVGFLGRIRRTATTRAVGETTVGIIDREFLLKEYNQLSGMFRSILETMSRRFAYNLDRLTYLNVKGKPKPARVVSLTCKDRMEFARAYTTTGENEGVFIRTENPLPSGESLILKLTLPGASNPLRIDCEVLWSRRREESEPNRPPGMMVRFLEMSEAVRNVIDQCIFETKDSGSPSRPRL